MPGVGSTGSRQTHRFLALGDSYTIGESVNEPDRWPNQLATRLHNDSLAFETPQILAKTGWTSGELLQAIDSSHFAGPFDLVSLLIGVNNQYRGLAINDFQEELDTLLGIAIRFAGNEAHRVIVLSIPDWSVTPFASDRDRESIASEIDRFNECKRLRARARNCHYVDITGVSRLATNDPSLLADDGLHPSAAMYAAWCDLLLPVIKQSLSSR